MQKQIKELIIAIKGAGEMASAIAWRLYQANLKKIIMMEIEQPLAVRREVCFCEAIVERQKTVEGVEAIRAESFDQVQSLWQAHKIAVMIDPLWKAIHGLKADVIIDAVLAKKNLGTSISEAPRVIALGPGFRPGKDAHWIIETNRGHDLGRILTDQEAEPDTGIATEITGITFERVLRASAAGIFETNRSIGESVQAGDVIGAVDGVVIQAQISGVIRGLLRSGFPVSKHLKIGDIDPRGIKNYCYTISDKARAISGSVLEAVLRERV
ncbi:MAG: EF2563 family selenium-dependent molybdenum hydroxylase system protein [Desulfobacteraceae bacterium]|nr:MAG: EF2563 family selenium-dependent molybdenum hydroxylase system protein [Desulfobacteraceae bacterium]